jgi:hypothetical protein
MRGCVSKKIEEEDGKFNLACQETRLMNDW